MEKISYPAGGAEDLRNVHGQEPCCEQGSWRQLGESVWKKACERYRTDLFEPYAVAWVVITM